MPRRTKHPTVKIGEYTIPLIGLPRDATLQECESCHRQFYIGDIIFTGKKFLCVRCQQRKNKNAVNKTEQ